MAEKKIKTAQMFFITMVVLFMIAAAIATIVLPKDEASYFENRMLSKWPEYTKNSIANGEYFNAAEAFLGDHTAGRNYFLAANTYVNMNIIRRPVVNDVVIQDNLLLPFIKYDEVDYGLIKEEAAVMSDRIQAISEYVNDYGGKYYYTAVPCQYAFYESSYPWYMNNNSEYTGCCLADLSEDLDSKGLSMLDMGPMLKDMNNIQVTEKDILNYNPQLGMVKYTAFHAEAKPDQKKKAEDGVVPISSTVDNHYSIFGAYVTYKELMNRINKDMGWNLEVLDKERDELYFKPVTNKYMGSRMVKLFNLWNSDEQLYTLESSKPLKFTRYDCEQKVKDSVYTLPDDTQSEVRYAVYMGGDIGFTEIDTNRENLPDILIYGDSFTNALESIIYRSFNKMYSIDFRYYEGTSLRDFIDRIKPDVVVCVRDYEALLLDTGNGTGI